MALSTPSVDQLFGGLPASQRLARFEAYKSAMSTKITENIALKSVGGLNFSKTEGVVKTANAATTALDALTKAGASEETIALFSKSVEGDVNKNSGPWSNSNPLNYNPGNVGFTPFDLQDSIEFLVPVMTPLRNSIPRRKAQGQAVQIRQITGYSNSRTGGVPNLNTFFNSATNTSTYNGITLNRPNTISYSANALVVPFVENGISDSVEYQAQFAAQGFTDLRQLSNTAAIYSHMLGEENNILNSTSTAIVVGGVTVSTDAVGAATGLPADDYAVITTVSSSFGESQGIATGGLVTVATGESIGVTLSSVPVGAVGVNVYATSDTTSLIYVGRTSNTAAGTFPVIWALTAANPSVSADNGSSPEYQFGGTPLGTTGYTGMISTLVGSDTAPAAAGYVKAVNGPLGTAAPFGEINTMLVEMWETNRAQPGTLYTSGRIQAALLAEIQQQGSATSYRANYMTGDDGIIVGGAVTGITSPVGGPALNIVAHPFIPEGVVIAHSTTLPSPVSGVPGTATIDNVVDLTTIEWPQIGMSYDLSTYQYGSFVFHTPGFDGILTGITTTL
jgi:hypothetical protein